jgi:hypothetical protein
MLTLGLGDAVELLVAFPKIEKQTKRHQPYLINGKMKMGDAIVKESSK